MFNVLIHIIAWAFCIVFVLGILGLILYMINLVRFSFSKKGFGFMPWWVFWRH